jgi:hypothetical protein
MKSLLAILIASAIALTARAQNGGTPGTTDPWGVTRPSAHVVIDTGTNKIGTVVIDGTSGAPVSLGTGTNSVGTVGLNTGTNAIGTVSVTGTTTVLIAPKSVLYLSATTTSTTTSVAAIDRVIVGTAGSADSNIVLKDGTTTLGTLATNAVFDDEIHAPITTGSMVLVNTGTTSGKITVTYH